MSQDACDDRNLARPIWATGLTLWLWLTTIFDMACAVLLAWMAVLDLLPRSDGRPLATLPLGTTAGLLLIVTWGRVRRRWWLWPMEALCLAGIVLVLAFWRVSLGHFSAGLIAGFGGRLIIPIVLGFFAILATVHLTRWLAIGLLYRHAFWPRQTNRGLRSADWIKLALAICVCVAVDGVRMIAIQAVERRERAAYHDRQRDAIRPHQNQSPGTDSPNRRRKSKPGH